ncbi:hypothetical protein DINM_006868 [Dirofilaria immitis]|nr:hypothetical protein [Dirofilaria immitis]
MRYSDKQRRILDLYTVLQNLERYLRYHETKAALRQREMRTSTFSSENAGLYIIFNRKTNDHLRDSNRIERQTEPTSRKQKDYPACFATITTVRCVTFREKRHSKKGSPDVLLGIETIAKLAISNPEKRRNGIDTEIGLNLKTRVIGTKKLMMDNQDNEALNAFQKFITHDKEGRYVVSWPWKSNDVVPAKGYSLALGRNLFQEGIIEKVKKEESKERVAYLPHQAMINP